MALESAARALEARLAPLERERRRTLRYALALLLATPLWAYFLAFLFQVLHLDSLGQLWVALIALPPAAAFALLAHLRTKLKGKLARPLAKSLGFAYTPQWGLPWKEAEASGLLPPADRYESEDLLEGEIPPFAFRASDLALYEKVRTKSGTRYRRFFSGALYRLKLPFTFPQEVRIAPQGAGLTPKALTPGNLLLIPLVFLTVGLTGLTRAGNLQAHTLYAFLALAFLLTLPSLYAIYRQAPKKGRVILESGAFERLFDVYGDQVEARKLLTPRVQEALVMFRRRLGKPFWAAFGGSEAWFLIRGRNRFEPSLLRPLNQKTLRGYVEAWTRDLMEAKRLLEAVGLDLEARKRGRFGGEDATLGPV